MPHTISESNRETQLQLAPLTREERLSLAREIRPARIAILSETMRCHLSDVLEVIELNTAANGCRLTTEIFLAKLKLETNEKNKRKFRDWCRRFKELEAIVVTPVFSATTGYQEANDYSVNWDRVRRLSDASFEPDTPTGDAPPASGRNAADGDALLASAAANVPSVAISVGDPRRATHSPPGGENLRLGGDFLPPNLSPLNIQINPFPPFSTIQTTDPPPALRSENNSGPPPVFFLKLDDLARPELVDRWFFQVAVARGWLRGDEVHRQRVHVQAKSVFRRSQRPPKSGKRPPGIGAFYKNVEHRRWHIADDCDLRAAQRAIFELENRQPRHSPATNMPQLEEYERRVQRLGDAQTAALARRAGVTGTPAQIRRWHSTEIAQLLRQDEARSQQ